MRFPAITLIAIFGGILSGIISLTTPLSPLISGLLGAGVAVALFLLLKGNRPG